MLVGSESALGIRLSLDRPEADRVVEVADQVPGWVIDEFMGTGAMNWQPCPFHPDSHPFHPDSHPLCAEVRPGVASWVCPSHGVPHWPVGSVA
jgi:hypothetical protein